MARHCLKQQLYESETLERKLDRWAGAYQPRIPAGRGDRASSEYVADLEGIMAIEIRIQICCECAGIANTIEVRLGI